MRRYWPLLLILIFLLLFTPIFLISWRFIPTWRADPLGWLKLLGVSAPAALAAEAAIIAMSKDLRDALFPKPEPLAPLQPISLDTIRAEATLGGWVKYVPRHASSLTDLSTTSRLLILAPRKTGKSREACELITQAAGDLFSPERIFTPSAVIVKQLDKDQLRRQLQLQPQLAASNAPLLLYIDDLPYDFTGPDLDHLKDLLDALSSCVASLYVVATARQNLVTPEDRAWLEANRFAIVPLPPLASPQVDQLVEYFSVAENLPVTSAARQLLVERSDGTPELTLRTLRRLKASGLSEITLPEADQFAVATLDEMIAIDRREIKASHPAAPALLDALAVFYAAGLEPDSGLVLPFAAASLPRFSAWRPTRRLRSLHSLVRQASGDYLTQDRGQIRIKDTLVDNLVDPPAARQRSAEFFLHHRRLFANRLLRRFYPHAASQGWALFSLALSAQESGDLPRAVRLYSAALACLPHPYFFTKRGVALYDLGQYQPALESYDRALAIDPQFRFAWFFRGAALSELGKYQQAVESFDSTLAIDPKDAKAWYIRGVALFDLRENQQAVESYNHALAIDPNLAQAWYNRGLAFRNLGQHQLAIDSYDRALAIDPNYASAWSNRAIALANLGQHQEAVESYDRALAIDPYQAVPWYIRALALRKLGQLQPALDSYNRALVIDPKDAVAWYNRGVALVYLGQYEPALDSYDRALAIDPNLAPARYNLACLFALQNNPQAACTHLEQAIALDPKFSQMACTDSDFDLIRSSPEFQALISCA